MKMPTSRKTNCNRRKIIKISSYPTQSSNQRLCVLFDATDAVGETKKVRKKVSQTNAINTKNSTGATDATAKAQELKRYLFVRYFFAFIVSVALRALDGNKYLWIGTVKNHGKRIAKHTANFCENGKNHGKTRHFVKITAFEENHGFRDFRVSVIFYCL